VCELILPVVIVLILVVGALNSRTTGQDAHNAGHTTACSGGRCGLGLLHLLQLEVFL